EKEADYERKPRTAMAGIEEEDEDSEALPIKLANGRIVRPRRSAPEHPRSQLLKAAEPIPVEPVAEEPTATSSRRKARAKKADEIDISAMSKKEASLFIRNYLAEAAQTVVEDPENGIDSLKRLRSITLQVRAYPQYHRLALLTQLAVFKDIIPGYMIRSLTEDEKSAKVSKEVKQLRIYEENLVRYYQQYLQTLDELIKDNEAHEITHPNQPSVAQVAVQCMCDLLVAAPHFNFRLNLLNSIVSRMSAREYTAIPQLCCRAITQLFQQDESGQYSCDAVSIISKMIKGRKYNVHIEVIKSFLHLRLREELDPNVVREGDSKGKPGDSKTGFKRGTGPMTDMGKAAHLSRKTRKHLKETQQVRKELQVADAEYSQEEKQKWHTETLKMVFITYFRILKNKASSKLLPAVLEGLARFAHLISVEFFADLLSILKQIMNGEHIHQSVDEDTVDSDEGHVLVPTRITLLCIVTAFQLLSGQGEALNIDLQEFHTQLYRVLPRLMGNADLDQSTHDDLKGQIILDAKVDSEAALLLKALEILFFKRGQVPIGRVAAFTKRLASTAMYYPPAVAVKCITLIRMLLTKYRRLDQLFNTEEAVTSGVYMAELDDPDLCNPFATSLYEIHV
ncbi:nucleolar complex-associated protein-domain-containing protein, partial [Dimargaris cristalligena]